MLAKGFFQHIGGRQRRNWIELALLSFFGRENLEEATLEEIEEVVNLHSTNLTSIRVIVGYPVQKAVSWEGNGHWVSLGQDVRGHSVQDTDKQSCPSTCLSVWPTNILLPLHSSGSLFGSCPLFCPCPCLQLIFFISHFLQPGRPLPLRLSPPSPFPISLQSLWPSLLVRLALGQHFPGLDLQVSLRVTSIDKKDCSKLLVKVQRRGLSC